MMRMSMRLVSGLTLCMLLAVGAALRPISADSGSDRDRPIRLYALTSVEPIGSITGDPLGAREVAVNGQVTRGDHALWGGELVQALSNEPVRLSLAEVGVVTLAGGSAVRVSTSRAAAGEATRTMLVASLVKGDLSVRLNEKAGAYVEARGKTFTASDGARFQIVIRDNRAAVNTVTGEIEEGSIVQQADLRIRALDELGRPISSGSRFSVRARSTRQVQIQVTDKDDKPVADLAILFSLGDPCLGSLGVGAGAGLTSREKTDNRGIAAVPLTAGAISCLGSITASIEGTNTSVTLQVQITKAGFFGLKTSTIVGASVIGVAAAGVGVFYATKDDNEITPVPPPVVRP